jgi:asparagine synthase (glutamine-hydrolysing)
MCGIAGIVGSGDTRAGMERMLAALAHRGPDGEGIFQTAGCTLGHRRLSIIDLAGGAQPLHSTDGKLSLVCNGEIYNYRELRAELEAQGQRFLTNSDCEVIIGLYRVHGEGLFDKLRGMFAFALWDSERKVLLAARDHLGQKPFFYNDQGGRFAFASEIKSLLALDPSLRQLDMAALDQYLGLRLIAPPLSMFRGVKKLPPGHYLRLQLGQSVEIRRYWNLEFLPKLTGTEDDLTDALEAEIEASLRLHLVSDVRVGAFLSGGMDSSLLVAMLAKRLGVRDLPTFTLGLPYGKHDEAPHARAVAELCGTEHHEGTINPSLVALLPDLVWHLDEPSDPLSFCTYQLAKLTSEHVKVVIGGDGGDELFGGYDRYYGNLYAEHYRRVPQGLRRHILGPALELIPEARWYKSLGHQLRWLHRLSFVTGGNRYAASLTYFYYDELMRAQILTPRARAELIGTRAEDALRIPFEAGNGSPLDRMLYADSQVRLPDHPVMITDRMTMAHGLEARSPFMDHKLAEFAARLPDHLKLRGRNLRYIQRKLAARYLPREILERPKQGFSSALPYLLRDEYLSLYARCLSQSELVKADVFDGGCIRTLLEEHVSNRADHGNRLWLLINAELWYRMAILGQSREDLRLELAPLRSAVAA